MSPVLSFDADPPVPVSDPPRPFDLDFGDPALGDHFFGDDRSPLPELPQPEGKAPESSEDPTGESSQNLNGPGSFFGELQPVDALASGEFEQIFGVLEGFDLEDNDRTYLAYALTDFVATLPGQSVDGTLNWDQAEGWAEDVVFAAVAWRLEGALTDQIFAQLSADATVHGEGGNRPVWRVAGSSDDPQIPGWIEIGLDVGRALVNIGETTIEYRNEIRDVALDLDTVGQFALVIPVVARNPSTATITALILAGGIAIWPFLSEEMQEDVLDALDEIGERSSDFLTIEP